MNKTDKQVEIDDIDNKDHSDYNGKIEEENWPITRRKLLRLGKAIFLMTGIYSLYPITKFLAGGLSNNNLQISKSEMVLSSEWQRFRDTRVWLKRNSDRSGSTETNCILGTCTHLGCELGYDARSGEWLCPCHGSRYNQEGQPVHGPANKPLVRLEVQETKDAYVVKLNGSKI